jgi:hypothetical protein
MLQQAFVTQWGHFTPIIYRMMERQYVKRFFETGELLVSSFDRFQNHADEERKDREGWNILMGRGSGYTSFAVTGHGRNAYILCGTAAKDSSLMKHFSSDAAIQVFDSTAFAGVITRHLPGVTQGFGGFCYYLDGSIESKIGDFDPDQLKQQKDDNTYSFEQLAKHIQDMAGRAVFFRKSTKFRHQVEYRWVWLADHPVTGSVVIHVPDARRFCAPRYGEDFNADS